MLKLFTVTILLSLGQLASAASDALPCKVGRHPPGKCPYDPTRGQCEEEGDCPMGRLCCDDGCGTICQNTTISQAQSPATAAPTLVPTTTGVCPIPHGLGTLCLFITAKGTCFENTDCDPGQLCCNEGCGKVCKTPIPTASSTPLPEPPIPRPVTIHKGKCPYVNMYVTCKRPLAYSCFSSNHCGANYKCCRDPCAYRCKRVHITKSGTCPLPPSGIWNKCRVVNKCTDDGDCRGTAKCCNHPCGKQCIWAVTAKPGHCEAPPSPSAVYCITKNDKCHKDGDCPGLQKCCNHPCGNQCRNTAAPPKPGICPQVSREFRCVRWQNDCRSDKDCPGKSKCCSTACGVSCVHPTHYLYSG
ncbi:WAP four-disulfide core domain protein 3 [Patella vulgata]|uniref:WAP four-disulfide core domain protein 3 n=1 Tax=Patella vulgata TaxID=6465 RepID=UPI0024A7B017|nr:WAP four-disulfide core domain protein 3 [Patella vulgata]